MIIKVTATVIATFVLSMIVTAGFLAISILGGCDE